VSSGKTEWGGIVKELLAETALRAARYADEIGNRRVTPRAEDIARLEELGGPLPRKGLDPAQLLSLLDEIGSPATVATTAGRYFGFVIGGTLPAALAANWLAGAWDQNACLYVMSPVAAKIEEIVLAWMIDAFGLPSTCGAGFVTGTTMANFTALAAARAALLQRKGWDVEENGLFGAPPLSVIVGDEVHVSLLKALALLGLGRSRVTRVPTDNQGRMRSDALPSIDDSTLVCVQAGNVNSGAFDPASEICVRAHDAGAWVHVDGAFGLWAAVSPLYSYLLHGAQSADSWAIDCHKWLNVPYDSGIAVVREEEHLRKAMTLSAAYLQTSGWREPGHYAPEASRRARGIDMWAAMRALGRDGLRDLVERNCRQAKMFADGLEGAGFRVLNDVVLNQVLVSFGSDQQTLRVIAEVQNEGTCWCGGTQWHGEAAMRISLSNWATTEEDVQRSLAAIIKSASSVRGD